MANEWKLYILRCCDGSLYTGITTDVQKRFAAHQAGKGAKYTRSRTPVEMVYSESCADKSAALRREHAIKNLTRKQKLQLIEKPAFNISAAAEKAIGMLREAGYEGWIVGGCVRDLLMGKIPHDWDMTTSALPHECSEIFSCVCCSDCYGKECNLIITRIHHFYCSRQWLF